MGIKAFYKWLVFKYPKIVVNVGEEDDDVIDQFDNLYLDMNGIIHTCFHPEHDNELQYLYSPITYDEVFNNMFEYIDIILEIVRPKKLLYIAIDGVAPRAKMNQQRARRFQNARDRETLEKEEGRLRRQYKMEGRDLLPEHETKLSDSNVITPGTEFMYELSMQLQKYIRMRIANHPSWKSFKVILSDSNVPGEGEHKIMSFIRLQRTCVGYDPNTRHVLYGLDSDLIILALATHEIHISILRENVNLVEDNTLIKKPHQFLHVWILREYLHLDLKTMNLPEHFELDIERLIDDFIFICFFAGNDFIPRMPTLSIYEGCLDLLIHVYKEEFSNRGGYLVDVQRIGDKKGCIDLERVEKFIQAIGSYEDKIFTKRAASFEDQFRLKLSEMEIKNEEDESCTNQTGFAEGYNVDQDILENTKMLKEQLKSYTHDEMSDLTKNGLVTNMVQYGSPGWKQRYYAYKFSAETEQDMEIMRKKLVEKYTEGLCWVLIYYFSGIPSWTWFFPYHYGPFASDLEGLSSTKVKFQKGLPYRPFDQLMAVLPPVNAHILPSPYQSLMTDENSVIRDFYYQSDFKIDCDGKIYLWQGILKLPFIDEERLLSATKKIERELTEEEAKRNMENGHQLFVHSSDDLALQITSTFKDAGSIKINMRLSGDICGFICRPKLEPKNELDVLCVYYDPPCFSVHIPRVLEGAIIPDTIVTESDIKIRRLWHEMRVPGGRRWCNRIEEPKSSPCVGFITNRAGSGWSTNSEHLSHVGGTKLPKGQSWWDTHGRGSRENGNLARTNSTGGQFWSMRGSSSNQAPRLRDRNADNGRW